MANQKIQGMLQKTTNTPIVGSLIQIKLDIQDVYGRMAVAIPGFSAI
jgi:hypothetical protein